MKFSAVKYYRLGYLDLSQFSTTESFSEREIEILHLLADGLSNREISSRLSISLDTVKWHNRHIFAKLDVSNRTQAANRAKELGLLAVSSDDKITSETPHNLPAQVTTFVGRQREVQEARQLLDDARLLTLTGPGGIGKTRLSLQLAVNLLTDFVDGVYFIPFIAVNATFNILWAIAEYLDFEFRKSGEPLDQLLEFFGDKHLLLLLDNFEHLLESSGILTDILKHTPNLKMLVTSRERLHLYGEVVYSIHGLALPSSNSLKDLKQLDSVQLFVQRANAISPNLRLETPDFQQIAYICQLVEGVPLGIELAASWVDVLAPQEIGHEIESSLDILATDLRDVPTSQHSIRAVFERSWGLLTDEQKLAFQNLAVFQRSFTREAARAIADVNLHTLQSLINKSLLRYDPLTSRYEQHELLRHYAAEELTFSGNKNEVEQAHAIYFADFMEASWQRMCGKEQKETLLAVEADIDNARRAWNFWIEAGEAEQIIKFFNAFWIIYDIKGWYPAGVELYQQGIDMMRTMDTPQAKAGLGWLSVVQGLYRVVNGYEREGFVQAKTGFMQAQEGLHLLRSQDRPDMMIIPLMSLIIAACHFNEAKIAREAAQEFLQVALTIEDYWGIAKARQFLAMMAIDDGHYDDARQHALDALHGFETSEDRWSKSILCTEVLGLLETIHRDFDAARHWIQLGLEAAEEIDFAYARQAAYWQFGYVETLCENYGAAAHYWQTAQQIGERIFGLKSIIGFSGSSNAGEWGGRRLTND